MRILTKAGTQEVCCRGVTGGPCACPLNFNRKRANTGVRPYQTKTFSNCQLLIVNGEWLMEGGPCRDSFQEGWKLPLKTVTICRYLKISTDIL